MPGERKVKAIEEMRGSIERCTVAISTDFSGMRVSGMTELRRALRQRGLEYRVVKNTLLHMAADAADRPAMKGIAEGPTAIAFGFGDPAEPARALTDFIRNTRSVLRIRGGVIGDRALTAQEVAYLATLPPRQELVAQLAGRLLWPAAGLVYVLNAPVAGLARVLQRRVEQAQA